MNLVTYLRGKFTGALSDLLRMSEGKVPPKQRCWRCDAGIPRTADGFHQKRRGVYVRCLTPTVSAPHSDSA
jgi:hypothetical protein